MAKVNLYSSKGVKKEATSLPKTVESDVNPFLIAQTLRVYEDNVHPGTAYAKTRAEVNKTGAKVWKQKGTGNARHGSKRAPIFVGGGKAHGPKGIKRQLQVPTRMKQMALKGAFNLKVQLGRLALVDGITDIKKTKDAQKLVKAILGAELKEKVNSKATVVLSEASKDSAKAFRNIDSVNIRYFGKLNAQDLLTGGFFIVDNSVFAPAKAEKKTVKKVAKK